MFELRHTAYNVVTGECLNCNSGNALKRSVAYTEQINRKYYNTPGKWRWCHDFGKKWETCGVPTA